MQAYGAEVVLTSAELDMEGAIASRQRTPPLPSPMPSRPSSSATPPTPKSHYQTTGPENLGGDTDGQVQVLVVGIGTGGTLTGAGRYLKRQNPDIKLIGVETHQ